MNQPHTRTHTKLIKIKSFEPTIVFCSNLNPLNRLSCCWISLLYSFTGFYPTLTCPRGMDTEGGGRAKAKKMSYCAMLVSSVCSLSKYKDMGGIPDSVQGWKLTGIQTSRYVVRWGCSCNKITEENTVDRATGFPCFIAIPLALCRTWENCELPEHYFL